MIKILIENKPQIRYKIIKKVLIVKFFLSDAEKINQITIDD